MTGGIVSPEYDAQIRETIIAVRRNRRISKEADLSPQTKTASRFSEKVVILDADLPAASHSLTGATNCLATVCKWSVDNEEYTETSLQLTVWNHSEHANHTVDTFGYIRHIDGHWHFFGDCHPMGAR